MSLFFLGDGLIQHLELQHVMRACMEENGMQFSEEQVINIIFFLGFLNSFMEYFQNQLIRALLM